MVFHYPTFSRVARLITGKRTTGNTRGFPFFAFKVFGFFLVNQLNLNTEGFVNLKLFK